MIARSLQDPPQENAWTACGDDDAAAIAEPAFFRIRMAAAFDASMPFEWTAVRRCGLGGPSGRREDCNVVRGLALRRRRSADRAPGSRVEIGCRLRDEDAARQMREHLALVAIVVDRMGGASGDIGKIAMRVMGCPPCPSDRAAVLVRGRDIAGPVVSSAGCAAPRDAPRRIRTRSMAGGRATQ